MTNALEKSRTELVTEPVDYNVGPEGERLQPPRARAGRVKRRQVSARGSPRSSTAGACALTALIVAGAILSIPRANITHIDNDITAWFSKEDPGLQGLRALPRTSSAAPARSSSRSKADSAERLFARDTLAFIERVTGDIERVDTVQRVDSLATATIVQATAGRPRRAAAARSTAAAEPRHRRRTIRQRLRPPRRSASAATSSRRTRTVTAIVVSFDEDRIDQVRAGVIQQIHDIVDPRLPAGREGVLQRQPRDQRDLQPRHARQPARSSRRRS